MDASSYKSAVIKRNSKMVNGCGMVNFLDSRGSLIRKHYMKRRGIVAMWNSHMMSTRILIQSFTVVYGLSDCKRYGDNGNGIMIIGNRMLKPIEIIIKEIHQ